MSRRRNRYYYEIDFEALLMLFGLSFICFLLTNYYIYIFIVIGIVLIYMLIRFIINKDIFGKFKNIVLYYNGNSSEKFLNDLKNNNHDGVNDYKINCIKKGIYGENKLLYVLQNSNIPMYILHDLNLEFENSKSQIDFLIITKRNVYLLEAKDLNGNLDIEIDGTFTRRFGRYKKGIKNPMTQNLEHEVTLNKILKKEKLYLKYKSVVVLTNDYSYINYKKGTKEKYKNIIRNDQLYSYISNIEKKSNVCRSEKKIKDICDRLLKYNKILFKIIILYY